MKSLLKKKGFTLIEVLIVVVIIGILAALILPRLLAQPERAITAEALNYLGVIRRAQDAQAQPGGRYVAADSGAAGGADSDAGWQALGFSDLPEASHFTYTCQEAAVDDPLTPGNEAANASCTATRVGAAGDNPRAGGTIEMSIDNGMILSCGAPYLLSGTAGEQDARCA